MHKKTIKEKIWNTFLVISGTFILAFGNIVFLVPLNINSGGLNGIGIIVRFLAKDELKVLLYNIVTNGLTVILWILGRIFLGKKFAYKTLGSSITYVLSNILLTSVAGPADFATTVSNVLVGDPTTVGNYLLCAVVGGVFVGAGCALSFVGGGSTGGIDVISFLLEKFIYLKQSTGTFALDCLIISSGMICLCISDIEYIIPCLCGIFSSFIAALVIDYVYIGSQKSYQIDIISDKWEEISTYVQDVLERGATIIPAKGGYKFNERVILRVIISRMQYRALKEFIANVDPKAFITSTETIAVFGEGFKRHEKSFRKK